MAGALCVGKGVTGRRGTWLEVAGGLKSELAVRSAALDAFRGPPR